MNKTAQNNFLALKKTILLPQPRPPHPNNAWRKIVEHRHETHMEPGDDNQIGRSVQDQNRATPTYVGITAEPHHSNPMVRSHFDPQEKHMEDAKKQTDSRDSINRHN